MATAYILAKFFVFEKSNRRTESEVVRFTIVNIVALFFVWGTSVLLARVIFPALNFTWYADDIAHIIGVGVPAITSYFGHRYFTFHKVSGS